MSEVARLYKYKGLLSGRGVMSAASIQAELEISAATFKRDIAKLRDQLHVPIVFDRDLGGYRIEQGHTDNELPGLWFSHDELVALLTIQQLISQLEPTLLAATLKPIQGRLTQLMSEHGLGAQDVAKRILMLPAKKRAMPPKLFQAVATATMTGKRITISHHNRHTATSSAREVSPVRLVHYRDNWYLDAWCHLRDDLRSFAVDAIEGLDVLDTAAKEVAKEDLDLRMGAGYGIFTGEQRAWATLKFSPQRSQWVAREVWHPDQQSRTDADGSFVLSIPYSDDRELVGDILRFGPEVEVLAPQSLRTKVQNTLLATVGRYIS